MTYAQEVAALAKTVQETEAKYNLAGDRSATTLPFMPYQPADFIGIVWECMPEIPAPDAGHLAWPTFLDVGCGPGTKMRIARDLFGFEVRGVEIDAQMAEEARKTFPDDGHVRTGDALLYTGQLYRCFDLIWLYRPFRDADRERELEKLITQTMKPGAILAGGSWETDLADLGWNPVVDDSLYDPQGGPGIIWRGAWQKPVAR
jgi:SAM-dependent methyltransferase